MKKGGVILCLLVWTAGGGYAEERELLIDSFEGRINSSTVHLEHSQGSHIKVRAERELKVCGSQSLKMEFKVKAISPAEDGFVRAGRGYELKTRRAGRWLIEPHKIKWSDYNAMSFMCYGRKSNAVIKFGIRDAKGEVWKFIFRDDFKGWKEIICPFDYFYMSEDEQPEGLECNKILDFPIKSFFFEFILPGEDTFYFDCVKLRYIKIGREKEKESE